MATQEERLQQLMRAQPYQSPARPYQSPAVARLLEGQPTPQPAARTVFDLVHRPNDSRSRMTTDLVSRPLEDRGATTYQLSGQGTPQPSLQTMASRGADSPYLRGVPQLPPPEQATSRAGEIRRGAETFAQDAAGPLAVGAAAALAGAPYAIARGTQAFSAGGLGALNRTSTPSLLMRGGATLANAAGSVLNFTRRLGATPALIGPALALAPNSTATAEQEQQHLEQIQAWERGEGDPNSSQVQAYRQQMAMVDAARTNPGAPPSNAPVPAPQVPTDRIAPTPTAGAAPAPTTGADGQPLPEGWTRTVQDGVTEYRGPNNSYVRGVAPEGGGGTFNVLPRDEFARLAGPQGQPQFNGPVAQVPMEQQAGPGRWARAFADYDDPRSYSAESQAVGRAIRMIEHGGETSNRAMRLAGEALLQQYSALAQEEMGGRPTAQQSVDPVAAGQLARQTAADQSAAQDRDRRFLMESSRLNMEQQQQIQSTLQAMAQETPYGESALAAVYSNNFADPVGAMAEIRARIVGAGRNIRDPSQANAAINEMLPGLRERYGAVQ